MGKKGRKKGEDYWESDAFMEDLEGVDPSAPQSISEGDEPAKGPGKKRQQEQKDSQEDGELDVSANQKGKNKKQQQQNKKGGAQPKKPQAEAGNVAEEGVEQQGEKTSEQQQKGASVGRPGQQKKQQQQGQKKPVKQAQNQEPQQKDQESPSLNAAGDSTKEKDDAGEFATDGEKSANDGNISATNEKPPLTAAQKKRLKQPQKKAAAKQQEQKPDTAKQQQQQQLDNVQESNQTVEKTEEEEAPAAVNEAEIASTTQHENEKPQAASNVPESTQSKPLTAAQKKRLKQQQKKKEEKKAAEKLAGSADTTSTPESPSPEAVESTKETTNAQEVPESAGTAADNDASTGAAVSPADESAGSKQLTAAQKKRLKQKQKKEAAKQADAANAQTNSALLGGQKAAPAGKKPVKKGPGAAIAALIRAQKEEEERIKKLIEEQERLAEEQRKKEEEEERRQQELIELKKKQKKEKAKARKQTAGERKRKQEMELAKKRLMMVEGVNFPSVDENRTNTAPTSIKKQFKKDKKKAAENNEAETKSEEVAQGGQANQTAESSQEPQKGDADDWEKLAESDNEDDWEKVVEKKVDAKPATPPVVAPVVLSPEEQKKKEEQDKKAQEKAAAEAKKKAEEDEKKKIEETRAKMRSPICCVLGHVDSGKTSLLDKIRRTTVQAGEAGGITQQIGASYFPIEEIIKQTRELVRDQNKEVNFNIPGLLIMDTPGHECFSNLRARGSSLCDIAILVVNILEGLKPQTIESIQLLRSGKTPFVVALNKIDKLFEWKSTPNCPFQKAFAKQEPHVQRQFQDLTIQTITQLAEQGLNSALYYENKDYKRNVSIVPTSAHTAEGLPDLLLLMTQLTQQMMSSRFLLSDQLQASVLEVKVVEGLGTTIDAIITDGELKEGDTIVCCGLSGPIVANIRSLLTPHPLKDIRTKTPYIKQKRVKAAMGVKIAAQGLDEAVAGSALLVYHPKIDDLEAMKHEVQKDLNELLKSISCDEGGRGVFVQASTLGSLEALLKFLKEKNIPVAGVNIGPVHKRDVVRASVMLEKDKVYAVILAFDVKIDREAQSFAAKEGVQIFCADVIYHLEEIFLKYMEDIENQRKESSKASAVWPCVLEIYPEHIFRTKDPITVGIKVLEGTARVGTPLVIRPGEPNELEIGKILSLEENHQQKEMAPKGSSISCSIAPTITVCTYGRQFDAKDRLYSKISRGSIDVLREHFAKEVTPEDRILIAKLKKSFHIP